MSQKSIVIITVLILVCQLIFSFFYSSLSVSLNQKYQSIYQEFQNTRNLNDQLKTKLAIQTSLSQLATISAEMAPIRQVIDLNQP